MKDHEYRISFIAGGINFYAYHSGTCEGDALKALLSDVEQNGCPPFFRDIKSIEKIESIECTY